MLNSGDHKSWVLEGLQVPPPVYSAALEPEVESKRKDMEQSLQYLSLEDPSIVVEVNEESGQTVVQGLGELHIDILVDRLKRQFKVRLISLLRISPLKRCIATGPRLSGTNLHRISRGLDVGDE